MHRGFVQQCYWFNQHRCMHPVPCQLVLLKHPSNKMPRKLHEPGQLHLLPQLLLPTRHIRLRDQRDLRTVCGVCQGAVLRGGGGGVWVLIFTIVLQIVFLAAGYTSDRATKPAKPGCCRTPLGQIMHLLLIPERGVFVSHDSCKTARTTGCCTTDRVHTRREKGPCYTLYGITVICVVRFKRFKQREQILMDRISHSILWYSLR
jgi:hypothetical protein